jgi:hypothetical protein
MGVRWAFPLTLARSDAAKHEAALAAAVRGLPELYAAALAEGLPRVAAGAAQLGRAEDEDEQV